MQACGGGVPIFVVLTITMVINHLLNGMILQVPIFVRIIPFIKLPRCKKLPKKNGRQVAVSVPHAPPVPWVLSQFWIAQKT